MAILYPIIILFKNKYPFMLGKWNATRQKQWQGIKQICPMEQQCSLWHQHYWLIILKV
jgi:hypothetical protein